MKHEYIRTQITATPFDNPHVKRIIYQEISHQNKIRQRPIDICDPFARESWMTKTPQGINTITNDLNEKMPTDYHMEANDFCEHMAYMGEQFDIILWDPPYNLSQLKRQYDGIGKKLEQWQTLNPFGNAKDAITNCLRSGGSIISFGFNSKGFDGHRGMTKIAIYNLEPSGNEYRYNVQVVVERKFQTKITSFSAISEQDA